MSETYSPAGNVSAQTYKRATAAEAATGTFGDEFMRQDMTQIADRIRFLGDDGFPNVSKIAFPATQVASAGANDLDDYEEGTFTPILSFGGASVGITYTTQLGRYTKVGRLVTVTSLRITLTSKGSSVGNALISGLPFAVKSGSDGNSMGATHFGSLASINNSVVMLVTAGSSAVTPENGAAASVATLTDANFTNGTDLITSFSYET